jgi:RIP homotypic interaction motif
MDPILLIVTALATGASAGTLDALKDDGKDAAKAAYSRLRALAKKRVAGRPDGELALERHATDPRRWEPVLTGELFEAGASTDADLMAAAKALMELVDEGGARSGKYMVTIKDSKGVQVGDNNIQVNDYSDQGKRRD